MQTPPDNLTKFLAAWGALLATFGLGWTLYRHLLDRALRRVDAVYREASRGSAVPSSLKQAILAQSFRGKLNAAQRVTDS